MTTGPLPPQLPTVQVLGSASPAVLLTGRAVHTALVLMRYGIRFAESRNAMRPTQEWLAITRALSGALASISHEGNEETLAAAVKAPSAQDELITTREAAVTLNLSARQVRNLADQLGARRVGRSLLYPRDLVIGLAQQRRRESA
jgi:hypothetical protein